MDEKSNIKSEILALIHDLTKAEPLLLVLNLTLGANIALVRGFHVSVLHERWSTALETIPVGDAVVFLCLFGLFLLSSMHYLRRGLIEIIFLDKFWKLREAIWSGPPAQTISQLKIAGFVAKRMILEKANRESNAYYLSIYRKYEEESREEWIVSSHALCTIVLLFADWWWDRGDSISINTLSDLSNDLSPWVAVVFGLYAGFVLLRLFLNPILQSESLWIHCPGFPDTISNEVDQKYLGQPPKTPSLGQ